MEKQEGARRVLVVGSQPRFLEIISDSLGKTFLVSGSATEKEGLTKARVERPDAIVLGSLEPRGASFRLHKRLREGWITKHIPLLVVDIRRKGDSSTGWTREEALEMDAEDYVSVELDDPASVSDLARSVGLLEKVHAKLAERTNPLKAAILDPGTFCVTWEQIPGRGAFEIQQEQVFENVGKASASGRIHAISVTDNPGGNPALSTEMLCAEIKKAGMEPLVHMACRDKNRSQIESMLYGLAAAGVRNVLVLSGDHTSADGYGGKPKPVFDVDPVHVLQLIETMNRGLEHVVLRKKVVLASTDIFAGAVVSPFKKLESELMGQYMKLGKKIDAGARFVVTQLGFDAAKYHEVLRWLKSTGRSVPAIANIYIMSFGAAKAMRGNGVPGCVVTESFLAELEKESASSDKGVAARILRAARQYAIAKGMGYAGAHIGGHGVSYEMVERVIEMGDDLSKDWESLVPEFNHPQKGGFYLFQRDKASGLCTDVPAPLRSKPSPPFKYRMSRLAHSLLFNEKSVSFRLLRPIARKLDGSPRMKRSFQFTEHLVKTALFECMNCGDCGLFDVAYICPMSQCPKQQRNGPCGGSYEGWCEVYPDERKCIWVQAYNRLKAYGEEDALGRYITPPCDWRLWQTSSWLNFYLGRDHTAKRLGIEPPRRE